MNKWEKHSSRRLVTVTGRKPNVVGRRKRGESFALSLRGRVREKKKK